MKTLSSVRRCEIFRARTRERIFHPLFLMSQIRVYHQYYVGVEIIERRALARVAASTRLFQSVNFGNLRREREKEKENRVAG